MKSKIAVTTKAATTTQVLVFGSFVLEDSGALSMDKCGECARIFHIIKVVNLQVGGRLRDLELCREWCLDVQGGCL